jgi:hypothetical protein
MNIIWAQVVISTVINKAIKNRWGQTTGTVSYRVCVCVCVCVCARAHTHVKARGHPSNTTHLIFRDTMYCWPQACQFG